PPAGFSTTPARSALAVPLAAAGPVAGPRSPVAVDLAAAADPGCVARACPLADPHGRSSDPARLATHRPRAAWPAAPARRSAGPAPAPREWRAVPLPDVPTPPRRSA